MDGKRMKIVLAISLVLMLSSCKVDKETDHQMFGNQTPYRMINLNMDNENYHCTSYDPDKSQMMVFICQKVIKNENNSINTSTSH